MANFLEDWVSGIGDWFDAKIKEILSDGITGIFGFMDDILNASYSSATKSDGLFASFISKHPADFTGVSSGVASGSSTVWETIETLCNSVVVPIAGFILAIVLINDLIQMCIRGNNFHDIDMDFFFKWIIKCICGIILVSNTYYIASGLFSFGTDVTAKGITSLFGGSGNTLTALDTAALDAMLQSGGYGIGELLVTLILSLLVLLILCILLAAIVLVMASRIIEVFLYLGVSPIPMATLMNEEWGQIGKNWINGVVALSFQGVFIVIALAIFKTIYNNVIGDIIDTGNDSSLIVNMLMLAGYAGALIFTVLRSGSISKSIFNAA